MNNFPHSPGGSAADAYERAFVRTVLRLNGVVGMPSTDQFKDACRTFERYGIEVAKSRRLDLSIDCGWLKDRMPEQAAVERAFLFVRFDSVLDTTAMQGAALHDWLKTGLCH
jgi:hypothetical protein